MLPSLSKLNPDNVCQPCTPTPTDAELDAWDEREEKLTAEELARIPPDVNDSRAECSICQELLRDEVEGSKEVIVAVDIDGACGHAFHKACIQHWFDAQVASAGDLTCPLCRKPFLDRKIDELYQRINGRRPRRPSSRPPRPPPSQRAPRNPIPEYPTLWEDAVPNAGRNEGTNWRLIVGPIQDRTVILIPRGRRADWTTFTHQAVCSLFGIDPERLTHDKWQQILKQSDSRQTWWIMYYGLMTALRLIAAAAPRAAAARAQAVAGTVRALARDVNRALAEGANWHTIMRSLLLGEALEEEED